MATLQYDGGAIARRAIAVTKRNLADRRGRAYRELVQEALDFAQFWREYAISVMGFTPDGTYVSGIHVTFDVRGYPVVRNNATNEMGKLIAKFPEYGTGVGPGRVITAKGPAHAIPNKYGYVIQKADGSSESPSHIIRKKHKGTEAMHVLRETKRAWRQIRKTM